MRMATQAIVSSELVSMQNCTYMDSGFFLDRVHSNPHFD
jgi:hypothetical protein